jgi:glycosyltransferase involved in cell wall biosynthesis
VLIISPLFWPSFGGIQQFNEKFILELTGRGYNVDLIILKSESTKEKVDQYLSSQTKGVKVSIGVSREYFFRFIFGNYSKVFFSQFSLQTLCFMFFPLRKIVVISHRDYPTDIEFLKSILSRFKLLFLRLPWIVNVAVSNDLARTLPKKTLVIHNRSWRFFPVQEVVNSNRDIDLLFVGRLDLDKGFDCFLETVLILDQQKGNDLNVTIVGLGPLRPMLESLDLQSLKRVKLQTYEMLDDSSLQSFFVNSRIVMMPSRYEGYGLVAVEALKAGCVLIANDIDAIKEATFSRGIYISDFSALAFALEVSSQLSRFKSISEDVWGEYSSNFDFRITVDEYLAISKS